MPTKDEILKKKGKYSEQLDLVDGINADHLKNQKRWLLILLLILTIGTSIGLSLYRQYTEGKLILSFSLPTFKDKNVWQVCFFDQNTSHLLYSQNCQQKEMPNITVNNNTDIIKSALPNGLTINESITSSSPEFNYVGTILSPKYNYLLIIKIYDSFSKNSSILEIPNLASRLYWRYSQ